MDVNLIKADSALVDGSDASPLARLAAQGAAAREAIRASCFAVVKKLGLELERRKISRETIIVEHVEKTPTEN